MKKILIASFAFIALIACNNNGTKEEKPAADTAAVADKTQSPGYQEGLELVSKNNCFTCHKIDEAFTGPTYRQVAEKYGNEPDTIVSHLAKKIISGGSGVWGQTPMIPHPQVSQADAEKMVKYILLLKK
jgi:cytochrome c